MPDSECPATGGIYAAGQLVAAEALHRPHTATTVRVRGGEVTLFDGPFAETREMLAGFYLDRRARPERSDPAGGASIPPAQYGSVEVRPVRALDPSR